MEAAGEHSYIGLNDWVTEGEFVWVADESPVSFSNWANGKPDSGYDGNCVAVLNSPAEEMGAWDDVFCHVARPFWCMKPPTYLSDCNQLRKKGFDTDGVYTITIAGQEERVFCDMTTDGGGWTVLLRSLQCNGTAHFQSEFWNPTRIFRSFV